MASFSNYLQNLCLIFRPLVKGYGLFYVKNHFLQEGTGEKASAAVQEGGELPGGRHRHQALPGLQVPEVYQVNQGHWGHQGRLNYLDEWKY